MSSLVRPNNASAAVAGRYPAQAIDHHDALGGGVEDRCEFFGLRGICAGAAGTVAGCGVDICGAPEKISAIAGSSSHEIENSRAGWTPGGATFVVEIATGAPSSDVGDTGSGNRFDEQGISPASSVSSCSPENPVCSRNARLA